MLCMAGACTTARLPAAPVVVVAWARRARTAARRVARTESTPPAVAAAMARRLFGDDGRRRWPEATSTAQARGGHVVGAREKTQYSLHVIYGVNEQVSGPVLCSIEDRNLRSYSASFPCKYLHCHFNFMATCLDEEPHDQPTNLYFAHQPTKLFFAECTGDGDDWCAPVDFSPDAGQARCFYCENQGSKIIHPAWPGFHGSDFQEAFFGSLSSLYNNDSLIGTGYSLDLVCGLEEDAIYEKNCKHQFRYDDGDAGNGLKRIKFESFELVLQYIIVNYVYLR